MKEGKVILFNFIVIRFLVWVHLSQAADSRWLATCAIHCLKGSAFLSFSLFYFVVSIFILIFAA